MFLSVSKKTWCTSGWKQLWYDIISQIFPEIKVIPEEELTQCSSCGCPPQRLLFFLFGGLLLLLNHDHEQLEFIHVNPSEETCLIHVCFVWLFRGWKPAYCCLPASFSLVKLLMGLDGVIDDPPLPFSCCLICILLVSLRFLFYYYSLLCPGVFCHALLPVSSPVTVLSCVLFPRWCFVS